jgi:hypothetical protein
MLLCLVVIPVILTTREATIRSGQCGQKNSRDSISTNKKLGAVVYACHPSYKVGIGRRIVVYYAQAGWA